MQVQAMVSFGAMIDGEMVAVRAGEVLALPTGADWLAAGLVISFEEDGEPVETASMDNAPGVEHAVTRKGKRK